MTSPVTEFYRGKTIFITGASGFMGKVLVEKLLYSFPDLKHVYILIRPKRGKLPSERIAAMWNLPVIIDKIPNSLFIFFFTLFHFQVFSRLRECQPSAIDKLSGIEGDVLSEGLGINKQSVKMLQDEVEIVFHCAATLKLEAKLKDAIDMNTSGTWRILQLCKDMSKLKVLVHLSTAFCYADKEVLDEQVRCQHKHFSISIWYKWLKCFGVNPNYQCGR